MPAPTGMPGRPPSPWTRVRLEAMPPFHREACVVLRPEAATWTSAAPECMCVTATMAGGAAPAPTSVPVARLRGGSCEGYCRHTNEHPEKSEAADGAMGHCPDHGWRPSNEDDGICDERVVALWPGFAREPCDREKFTAKAFGAGDRRTRQQRCTELSSAATILAVGIRRIVGVIPIGIIEPVIDPIGDRTQMGMRPILRRGRSDRPDRPMR